VAGPARAVPRAAERDEGAAAIARREDIAIVEREAQRRRVRLEEDLRGAGARGELGPRALALAGRAPRIEEVRGEVGPRPAVERAVVEPREVVGDEIVAEPVALVDRRVEGAGVGLEVEPDRV